MQVSRANAKPAAMLPLARYFSQTSRVAQDENPFEEGAEATESPAASDAPPRGNTVFISNMTFDATDIHVQEAFSKYGEITELRIARDGRGLSRGYVSALIHFSLMAGSATIMAQGLTHV